MDPQTLKRMLHASELWPGAKCPCTWDESVREARARLSFRPSERPSWLDPEHTQQVLDEGARELVSPERLGRLAAPHWLVWLGYW